MQPTVSTAPPRIRSGALSYLSLFTSLSTLLCCALPSLFVLLGLGATVASLLSQAPWLVAMGTLCSRGHLVQATPNRPIVQATGVMEVSVELPKRLTDA